MEILILNGATCGDAIAHSGPTGIVKEWMGYFKASRSNLKKSERTLNNENFASLMPLANGIAGCSVNMSDYFPLGSDIKPS